MIRKHDVRDALLRLVGLVVYAASVMVMTVSIYCWGN